MNAGYISLLAFWMGGAAAGSGGPLVVLRYPHPIIYGLYALLAAVAALGW